MRGETQRKRAGCKIHQISIHSPHAGRDVASIQLYGDLDISIHSPHAGRDMGSCASVIVAADFNPLSPCGERPISNNNKKRYLQKFQSTLPMRGETRLNFLMHGLLRYFNPLSPCGERPSLDRQAQTLADFNPLSPCGERRSR